jgi:iron complex outermembrane receptor protein
MIRIRHLAALQLALLTSAAQAEDPAPVFTLGEVRITGAAESRPSAGESTLEKEELRRHDRETVGTALNLAPGVTLSKVGARNEEMVYVRGFDLRQVPVFVDGIPVYVPYDGYVDLGRFTTYGLSRIEVSKGWSSLVFGPNALGGAINVVSLRPTKPWEGEMGGGLTFANDGANQGYHGFVNLGTRQPGWYAQASGSYVDDRYFKLPASFAPAKGEDGKTRNNSDHRDRRLDVKAGYTPNDTDEYVASYVTQHGVKGTPPYAGAVPGVMPRYWRWPYWDKDSFHLFSSTRLGPHALKLRGYYDTYRNSLFAYDDATYGAQSKPSSFQSWYDDYTYGASAQADLALGEQNVLEAAYHVKVDMHREHNWGEPIRHMSDRTQSLAVEDSQVLAPGWTLVAGISYSRRESLQAEDYDSKTKVVSGFARDDTGAVDAQLGLFQGTPEDGALHVTVGRRTRFPTIKDRYSYRLGTAIPNPSLAPEVAIQTEVGYRRVVAESWLLGANLFYSNVRNLIQSVAIDASRCPSPPCTQMQNVGRVRIFGTELSAQGALGPVQLGAHYTYLDRKSLSDPKLRLTDTPSHAFFGQVVLPLGSFTSTGSVEASSARASTTDLKQVAPGFATVALKEGYRFDSGLSLEAGVRNLFDTVYSYTEGFPEPGRTYFVQLDLPL